jgi:hypothetical protein
MEARYPGTGLDYLRPYVVHLLAQSPDQLRALEITGALANLLAILRKRPEWQGRLRRCLYQFSPKSGNWGTGCLDYFADNSPAGNARGCRRAHTVRVTEYLERENEGGVTLRRP